MKSTEEPTIGKKDHLINNYPNNFSLSLLFSTYSQASTVRSEHVFKKRDEIRTQREKEKDSFD